MTGGGLPLTCLVALPIPNSEPYSYRIPGTMADRVVPGARVVVPVRTREMVGIVVDTEKEEVDGLKSVLAAPDPSPLLTTGLLKVARWISRYYGSPFGVTLKGMLPGPLWGASRLMATVANPALASGGFSAAVMSALESRGGRASAAALSKTLKRPVWEVLQRLARSGAVELETETANLGPRPRATTVVVLSRALPSLLQRERTFGRATRQRELYETIDALGGEMAVPRLTGEFGFSSSLINALVDRGVAVREEREVLRDPFQSIAVSPPPGPPTDAQRAAIDAIRAMAPGEAATLFGVTGSGKTLVYLEAMRRELDAGKGAIVLVPEIALTPQTIARVKGVFGDLVAVLHSSLSDGERADAWRALARGERRVAIGARSAVFAPIRDLAAIVIDEEHDASYKNSEQPRYHAREVALRRARYEGARVVLGSATPSLETWERRESITVLRLPQRATARPLPAVELLDLRGAPRVDGSGPVPWSQVLDDEVHAALGGGDQVILLLNRRGFAHFLQCRTCASVCECPSCSIALTVHRTPAGLRCHYCGFERAIPSVCDVCGGEAQRSQGVGTQSLERWLAQRFPDARLARMDADTTATKWSHGRILDEFARGDVDILFGTQMISKGLDFPGVTLVGVVNADTGLHLPDFRAAERTFQLIAQVAGRAGRGEKGGRVIVQTMAPDHYALQAAARHDYEGFAERELEERRAPAYPPHVGLVNVVVSGAAERQVGVAADEVAGWLRGLVETQELEMDVLGPAPAPLARIKKRWRWHVVLRSADRRLLGRVIRYSSTRVPHVAGRSIRVIFDRDPVTLL